MQILSATYVYTKLTVNEPKTMTLKMVVHLQNYSW